MPLDMHPHIHWKHVFKQCFMFLSIFNSSCKKRSPWVFFYHFYNTKTLHTMKCWHIACDKHYVYLLNMTIGLLLWGWGCCGQCMDDGPIFPSYFFGDTRSHFHIHKEMSSKLSSKPWTYASTLYMMFNVTYHLELRNAIIVYCASHFY